MTSINIEWRLYLTGASLTLSMRIDIPILPKMSKIQTLIGKCGSTSTTCFVTHTCNTYIWMQQRGFGTPLTDPLWKGAPTNRSAAGYPLNFYPEYPTTRSKYKFYFSTRIQRSFLSIFDLPMFYTEAVLPEQNFNVNYRHKQNRNILLNIDPW